ncbi:MAG: DUF4136 domain-containing protein [Bacteroidales bacterium]|nr:DUF4136 domain-containing protein [Bacteroidales bacterium]MBR1960146.1 DUF4136 domain-containing protein [Bacteroidales bacterium]
MKKILLISAAVMLLAACHKEPYPQDGDNQYLVYTSPGKDVNFTQFQTFDIADSLLVIGQSDKPMYSQSNNALALIQAFRTNMEKRGFIYTPSDPDADLGIQLTYVIKTERYVQYYDDPYWWLDYPGYWPSGYWGNWTGFYYPRPVTYTYTTNALLTDIVNLTGEEEAGKPLEILWTSYIGGPAGASLQGDIKRMEAAIDQAFVQSAYLTRTQSK